MQRLIPIGVFVAVALALLAGALFTVDEREQAIVLQFGDPKQVVTDAGLNVKLPFIQDVRYYDRRVLDLDPPVEQVVLGGQRRLNVDTLVRYRIANPLQFYQTQGTINQAEGLLSRITNAAMRRVLGQTQLLTVLSAERARLMQEIRRQVNVAADDTGMDIVDVRMRRADLPEETSKAIYERMRSERQRVAAEFRAQGREEAQEIRSRADRERTVILAEARRRAQVIRGKGDRIAFETFAVAANQNPKFYEFYRTMQAYEDSLKGENTRFLLSPQNDFLKFFRDFSANVDELPDVQREPSVRLKELRGPDVEGGASGSAGSGSN